MSTETSQPLRGARAIVTGASGFIGSALTRRLTAEGAEVCALYRRSPANDMPGIVWRHCEMENEKAVRGIFATVKPDFVFHLASHVSGRREVDTVAPTLRDNLISAVNVLTAATESACQRVVLTGSMEEPMPGNEWAVPASPYAAAKLAASAYGRMYHLLYGTPVVQLRLFMVYGPGQRDLLKLIPYTILSLLRGVAPKLSRGERLIDWVYVDDVVDSYIRAALRDAAVGATIDIASGTRTTVRSVVERVATLVGSSAAPQFGAIQERTAEQEPVANLELTERLLQWRPATSLDDGLDRTVAWYREHMALSAAS